MGQSRVCPHQLRHHRRMGGRIAVMVAADLVMLYVPTLPRWVGIAATVAALYGAFSFTGIRNEIKKSPNYWCLNHA